jgi:ERI1 exoribonuclease 3
LTGIEQVTVDSGIPLADYLGKFDKWMDQNGFNSSNSIFVTCRELDLKTCLPHEAGYKSLKIRADLRQWINIKIFFNSVTNIRGRGMDQMLKDLELNLDGKHHSGINDSKNISKILVTLLKKGATLTNSFKKTVPSPY